MTLQSFSPNRSRKPHRRHARIGYKSKRTVFKRGREGYAGVVNPLFFKDNNRMYFGDAKASMEKLNQSLTS